MSSKNNNKIIIIPGEEELNEENIFVLNYSEKNYAIKVQLVNLNKKPFIRIIAQEEKKIVNFNYMVEMNEDDFNSQDNILLRPYRDIQGIYLFILGSFEEGKISIADINQKIHFNLVIEGEIRGYKNPFTFEIKLKKRECNKDDIEEMICNKTNELENENKNFESKLNVIEKENNNIKIQVNELNEKENKYKLKLIELEEIIRNLTLQSKQIIKSEEENKYIKNRLLQIPGRENKNICLKLKYRMTEDGDSLQMFHSKCDNIPNNLVLIKSSSGARFGGYTDEAWTSGNNDVVDNNCFCFSLSNRKLYNVIQDKAALHNHSNHGPSFNNIFYIGADSLSYGKCTNCVPSNEYFSGINNNFEINGGNSEFTILELEFYQVIFEEIE
ncbi:hypothetical protein H8356DRAFT_1745881 [Neocallimastix lanati (nom. inval.)]|uniref:TLDc domain-containing protein n=1 Tax=Neocallimastix californiae TaxID=1754190 RepID=A0A1Y2ACB3_9FUNG|nr:hypothetical protein H8356DRAFT_1745881 [Neocallimastix sp. JGI-2020a]ORY20203.1 hypothetical protein LY90DRAFT_676876 [Neocallimastix californiae]|eukprot:ORY20203.1 hypothetical protein LY90DRAFT_676876 [Neocallimastix californiae]